MAEILERSNTYGVTQSLIDAVGFWGINYVGNAVSNEIPKAKTDKTIIFLASDIMVRNEWITFWKNKFLEGKGSISMTNAYISLVSLILGTLYDLLRDKNLGEAFMKNLINNALGMLANIGIDNLMTNQTYV